MVGSFQIENKIKGDNRMERIEKSGWPLFRIIVSAFPRENIFTGQAKKTTALGPVMVATVSNKLWAWRVEVIDENNYKGPRDNRGLPDHSILQKENPASIVGFYCGLTSTIERVWKLVEFYHQEGIATIAGGWHAHYCSEETLMHNIDVVVHGEVETVIKQILVSISENQPFDHIPGISWRKDGEIKRNLPHRLETPDLDNLPYPDFGLVKYARIKIYPISMMRGCSQGCEFCCVRGKPRWSSPQHLFEIVDWLVKTRRAKSFFIIDDRFEEDKERVIEFLRLVKKRYGNRLRFSVQIRLDVAENIELVKEMAAAGIRTVFVGCESPIDEDLAAMNKGYTSAKMLEWAKILTKYFWVHEMFMFGYPPKQGEKTLNAQEIERRFRIFIRKTNPFSVQVLKTTPCPGTLLWRRLEKEGRVFPRGLVPWNRFEGNFVCFKPDNMTLREFQEIPERLMSRFYNPLSSIKILLRTIIFPIDYLVRGWKPWYQGWYRDVINYGGHLLLRRWRKKQKDDVFIKELEKSIS